MSNAEKLHVDHRGLPEYCFVALKTNNDEVVMVHRDQMGYSPTREGNLPWYGQETADEMNRRHGITKAQAKAMEIGSMFGWHVPAANPDNYDDDSNWKN
jgi:hypothetical protein